MNCCQPAESHVAPPGNVGVLPQDQRYERITTLVLMCILSVCAVLGGCTIAGYLPPWVGAVGGVVFLITLVITICSKCQRNGYSRNVSLVEFPETVESISSSQRITREIELSNPFSELILRNGGTVKIVLGDRPVLRVFDEEPLPRYTLNGEQLALEGEDGQEYELTLPDLNCLTDLNCSGSVNVVIPSLSSETFNCEISESGRVKILHGEAGSQAITISGNGIYEASNLKSRVASVNISDDGDADIYVTEWLNAQMSSGRCRYSGNPRSIEKSLTPRASFSGSST